MYECEAGPDSGEALSLISISSFGVAAYICTDDFMKDRPDRWNVFLVGVRWMEGSKSPSSSGEGNGLDRDDIGLKKCYLDYHSQIMKASSCISKRREIENLCAIS